MLIQKIFHVHQPVAKAKAQLTSAGFCQVGENTAISITGSNRGVARVECDLGFGPATMIDLVEIPTDEPDVLLFGSSEGNVQVAGVIEFVEIRDALTEVVLTLDYEIKSPLHRAYDAVTGAMDRFLSEQFKAARGRIEEMGALASGPLTGSAMPLGLADAR